MREIRVFVVGTFAVVMASCAGSSGPASIAPPTTQRVGNTDAYSYTLSCPSPIGDLTTSVTYTVTDSAEDVKTGQPLTYQITAPIAQVKAPITPTFQSSTTTFALPAGFQATSASTDPPKNDSFSSSSAQIQGTNLVTNLAGDFSLDGTNRTTPTIIVNGTVTAKAGDTITWTTPTSVVGNASAGFLGTQTSNCTFPTSGPIGRTNVA
jgi:hypothetical protein